MVKNNYLALGGLFITLHLLFVFISRMLVGSELILVIFLPLLSTIYSLKFNMKEVTMFFIATFLLCVIFEPISTFIYVLPALICGTLYGMLRKKKVKELSLVYLSSLSHVFSLLISFLFISIMFQNVEFFEIFSKFINKEGKNFYISVFLILLLLGLLESFLVHMITNNELKRLGYSEIESEKETPLWMCVAFVFSLVVYIVLSFITPLASIYVFPFLLAFTIPLIVEFISFNNKKWIYFIVAFLFFICIFIIKYIDTIFYPALFILMFFPITVEKFVRVLYTNSLKYSNNGKNKIE